jgi:hypothetical protein
MREGTRLGPEQHDIVPTGQEDGNHTFPYLSNDETTAKMRSKCQRRQPYGGASPRRSQYNGPLGSHPEPTFTQPASLLLDVRLVRQAARPSRV